ncbi:ANTAR domain-containing protein [Paucimonas lemoignei]|uniref:ANTAR domain-containing protein n=1 Tax=Paucimonas lemoignei TaxID=29443 RepID=A0A4R3I0Z3_PAULE|nr:nitrate regulatory protein [Paucimonas lemoignei]TCS38361.1 ANTAR domain-containing protein [Paucimonas lemoignei]
MNSGLNFLVAARQCEIGELEQLARTGELVGVISRFTHELQRERGISNLFLGAQGKRFGKQLASQVAECRQLERDVRQHFARLDTDAIRVRNGARLFSRIAVVLHALDGLAGLRHRIATQALTPGDSTEAFSRLISGLLAVVFEAADSASDPAITRALVAMFNFMQGKEFAGQERAFGVAIFASGYIDTTRQHHWRHLVESQEACFQVFSDFADAAIRADVQASQDIAVLNELERLRRAGFSIGSGGRTDPGMTQAWYDCCTRRIDAMKAVEDSIVLHLRQLCERKIAQARTELRDHQTILDALTRQASAAPASTTAAYGPNLERSVVGMLQEQSRRLQVMSDELDTVRTALNERKTIERAKGLLMAHRQLSEQDAYKMLRRTAMNQKRRLIDVAEAVLAMSDMLPRNAL